MKCHRAAMLAIILATAPCQAIAEPRANFSHANLAAAIGGVVESEIVQKNIPAVAIALVDRDGPIWASAWAQRADGVAAAGSMSSRFRIGTMSSLFTTIAILQQVDAGKLDLDAPVQRYLSGFHPQSSRDAPPITLRHLLSHRSGLVREAPVGSYWDEGRPTIGQIVDSLNPTMLAFRPGADTKYSNAGVAVAASILEVVTGSPFETYVRDNILRPLAMDQTSFDRGHGPLPDAAVMQSIDWERRPTTNSGTANIPARGVETSIRDFSRFAQALLGKMPGIRPETLATAFSCGRPRCNGAFGLGFAVDERFGRKRVGLRGSTYGYVAELQLYPDENLAIATFGSSHEAPTATRLGKYAAGLALGEGAEFERSTSAEQSPGAVGYYRSARGSFATIRQIEGRLWLESTEVIGELRRQMDRWVVDDTSSYYDAVEISDGTLSLGTVRYHRQKTMAAPAAPSPELSALIGDYGWDHDYFRIFERGGELYARSNWVRYDRLLRRAAGNWEFADPGSDFRSERLQFVNDRSGATSAVRLNGAVFPRRHFGEEAGSRLKALVRSSPDLADPAWRASPPTEPAKRTADLVSLNGLADNIRLDIRYASTDNFMGMPVYDRVAAYLQRPAASALQRVAARLKTQGFGLVVHDAYRPWAVTKIFWDATPAEGKAFVADPAQGSRHNRGSAVDLSMYDLKSGRTLEMPGFFDEMSSRSYSNYMGGSSRQRWLRDVLRASMQAEGLNVLLNEWWHFDHVDWASYPIGNQSFGELEARPKR